MAEKATRKELSRELKQPDEFQVIAGKAMDWLIAHQRLLFLVLGAAVAAVLLAWGAAYYMNNRESKAGAQLAAALEIAQRPVVGEGVPQTGEQPFATKDARAQALQAELEKVRTEAKGTAASRTAALELGYAKLRAGDAANAIPLLQEFTSGAATNHPLKALALEALGYAQEATGKLDDARATFASLASAGAPERAAYQSGRLALVEGKKDEARKTLTDVAKDYAKDPVALEANLRLELMSLPPAPPPGSVPAPAPTAAPAPAAAPEQPAPKATAKPAKGVAKAPVKPAKPAKKK